MSIKNREGPCHFVTDEGLRIETKFTGIREMGFSEHGSFVVDCWTTEKVPPGEPRGSYMTSIPISPLDYRLEHPTRAGYSRTLVTITLYSDWGSPYTIKAHHEVIDALVLECIAHQLPLRQDRP